MKKERLFKIIKTGYVGTIHQVMFKLNEGDKYDPNDFKMIFRNGLYEIIFCDQTIAKEVKNDESQKDNHNS